MPVQRFRKSAFSSAPLPKEQVWSETGWKVGAGIRSNASDTQVHRPACECG